MPNEKEQNKEIDEETLDKTISDLPVGTLEKAMRQKLNFTGKEATRMAQYYRKHKARLLLNNPLRKVLEIIDANDEVGIASREAIIDNDLLKP